MGLSKSKTKQTNDPSAFAKPFIQQGTGALNSAYEQAQPFIQQAQATLGAQLPGLADRAFGANPGLDAATAYNTRVAGGEFLDAGNPYLQGQIDQTNDSVRDRVAAQFSSAGRTGSGANQMVLGKALAGNETALRYSDYDQERARMGQAAALTPSLNGAQYTGLGAFLQAQQGMAAPLDAARAYSGGLGSLVGGYNTQTTTSTPSLGMILAQMAGNAASAYGGGG